MVRGLAIGTGDRTHKILTYTVITFYLTSVLLFLKVFMVFLEIQRQISIISYISKWWHSCVMVRM